MVCERWCVTEWCVKEGVSKMVPRLLGKTTVDVRLRHACHVKQRWMSPSAMPATQSAAAPRASRATKPGPEVLFSPSAMSEAPATQNDRGCEIVPRLPREINVDVAKCHACHAKCGVCEVIVCYCMLMYVKFVWKRPWM